MGATTGLAGSVASTVRSLFEGETLDPIEPTPGRPVLLLHGFAASSTVLEPLQHHLASALGRPVLRLGLGGRLPLHLDDIRRSAARVHRALDHIAAAPRFEYADVVGHSMGGLVATHLLQILDRGRRVRRVVTLGAPHVGTPIAALGVLLFGAINRAVWQMLPGASLVEELSRAPVPAGSSVVAVSGAEDAVVPPAYARVPDGPGRANVLLPGLNHFQLVQAPAFASVRAALAADTDAGWYDLRPAA